MAKTEPTRRRGHAASTTRVGVVGVAGSLTFALIATMGASTSAEGEPATQTPLAVPKPIAVPSAPEPAPVVIIVRRPVATGPTTPTATSTAASAARPAAPIAASAPRPALPAAPAPVTRTSGS